MNIRSPFQALGTAVRTLTVLPFPGREAASLASALPFFPVVGAVIGCVAALVSWVVGSRFGWEGGAAVAAVVWLGWVSGGLHLDGLADTSDGLAGGRTPERALEIMKDSRIGVMGACALTFALLIKFVALSRLIAVDEWMWIPIPVVLARLTQVHLAVFHAYARREGGTAQRFVQGAGRGHYATAWISAAIFCVGLGGPAGLVALLMAGLVGMAVGRRMNRRLGGVTGDVLGYASEMTETVVFFLAALVCRTGLLSAPWQLR